MSVLRPRTRLLYFRVSEDEYERLSGLRDLTGSRSISDLARSALWSMIENTKEREDHVCERLTTLETSISSLSNKIQWLYESMGGIALDRNRAQSAETAEDKLGGTQ